MDCEHGKCYPVGMNARQERQSFRRAGSGCWTQWMDGGIVRALYPADMDAVKGLYRGTDVIIGMGALAIGFCRENSDKGWDVHIREHAAIEVHAGNTAAHACLLAQQVGHRCTYPRSHTAGKPNVCEAQAFISPTGDLNSLTCYA